MKIHSKRVAPDVYSISFGETEVVLQGNEVKTLLMQLMEVLTPEADGGFGVISKEEKKRTEFLARLPNANDVGVQKLLLVADHRDLLALLKSAENNAALRHKFFSNMSDNNAKMFNEDLNYEFRDGLPENRRCEAIDRLIALARDLELDGDLVFGKPSLV